MHGGPSGRGGLTRRQTLRSAIIAGLLAQLGGCGSSSSASDGSTDAEDVVDGSPGGTAGDGPASARDDAPRPWVPIDAHCHLFNGLDVPVRGFLEHVTLAEDPDVPSAAVPAIAWLADRIVQQSAKSIDDERAVLEALLAAGRRGEEPAAPTDSDLRRGVEKALQATPKLADELASARGDSNVPDWLLSGAKRRYVEWAWMLTGYRHEACAEMFRAFGRGDDGVQLFVPALVDLDLWLGGDSASTSMDEQTEILALVSRLHGGRVHGFVGFNPWRAALDGTHPNEAQRWVMNAVKERGFLGVKLYPPMGFAPSWNGRLPPVPGQPKGLGKEIDRVLAELFAWCEAHDVPLMAHCEDGNQAGPDLGKRADPRRWEPVLNRHPKLRLNLAHFGGLSSLADSRSTGSWSWAVAELMDRFEHVYADVGHFDEIAEDGRLDAWLDGMQRLRARHPVVARRIMYGSDWHLLAKERAGPSYLRQFRAAYGERFGRDDLGRFLGGNAADFLGVRGGGVARDRLAGFYTEHAMAPPRWFEALA